MEEVDYGGMISGVLIALFMVAVMIIPIYCCQISNEEYEKIVNKIKEGKKRKEMQKENEKQKL